MFMFLSAKFALCTIRIYFAKLANHTNTPEAHSASIHPARLACVRHAASVHPEPGSNSQVYYCWLVVYNHLFLGPLFRLASRTSRQKTQNTYNFQNRRPLGSCFFMAILFSRGSCVLLPSRGARAIIAPIFPLSTLFGKISKKT